jgi:hypothetical protein
MIRAMRHLLVSVRTKARDGWAPEVSGQSGLFQLESPVAIPEAGVTRSGVTHVACALRHDWDPAVALMTW